MNFLQPIDNVTFAFLETIGQLIVFTGTAPLHSMRQPLH
jgi:hypothetical protein